jgi:hypothetical protein
MPRETMARVLPCEAILFGLSLVKLVVDRHLVVAELPLYV